MRFRTRRKGGGLLMADMDPVYPPLLAHGFGDPVQAVANQAIDTPHAGLSECLFNEIGDTINAHKNRPRSDVWSRGWRRMHAESGVATTKGAVSKVLSG